MIAVWPKELYTSIPDVVWTWISMALEHANGERSLQDVKNDVLEGSKQVWLHNNDEELDFCMVTQIIEHPNKKTCEVVYTGGEGMLKALDELKFIEEWAVLNGCKDIQAIGRQYMKRSLKPYGYEQRYITVGRDL